MNNDDRRGKGPRCIALVGPFASGKTSLLEAILARTGAIKRQGHVNDSNMVGDASPEARAHKMSVGANIAECEFMGETFTFIDCPGSVEFLHESQAILAACDMALVVCEGDEKKIPALQIILKRLEIMHIPYALFLNKIDKAEQSIRDMLEQLQQASEIPLVLRQIPIWEEGSVTGFIDLALERAFIYRKDASSEVIEMSAKDRAREEEARFAMLESVADYDDDLMEKLLEDIVPEPQHIYTDLVKEMRDGLIHPVFIGSAEEAHGISRLLKAIRHEAPDIAETRTRLAQANSEATVLQIQKVIHTHHAGKLSIARILSGSVSDGDVLYASDTCEGRVSGLFRIMGEQVTKRKTAYSGETVGLGKLENGVAGGVLTSAKGGMRELVTLDIPMPVMGVALTPKERKDEVKLSSALQKICEEDPSVIVEHHQDTGETLLRGQGEMHIRVVLEQLIGKYGIDVETHIARVPYKETVRSSTTIRGRYKKQSGGHGQFGDVVLQIKPLSRGHGFAFDNTISGGVVPKQYIPSVESGIREYLARGPLGFPIVDIAVTLTDGSYHTVDSSDQAFKMAAQVGMREGMPKCSPVLLEPILAVDIACPSDTTARINTLVSQHRGQLLGYDTRPGWSGWDIVKALMPEAEIVNLIIELRSATAGAGTFSAEFNHLAELTGKLADEILKRSRQAS